MYKIWIIQNIYSYSVDRNSIICKYQTGCKMNKRFHNYTTQIRKEKEVVKLIRSENKKRSLCRRLLFRKCVIVSV